MKIPAILLATLLVPSIATGGMLTVAAFGPDTVYLGPSFEFAFRKSYDAGRTWQEPSLPSNSQLKSMHFSDSRHGWIVGLEGIAMRTSDAGNSWSLLPTEKDLLLGDVFFLDKDRGWLAGGPRAGTGMEYVLATTDGGRNWIKNSIVTWGFPVSIHFQDSLNGWMATEGLHDSGEIWATSDGGKTWGRQYLGYKPLTSVYFKSPSRGWAVGASGLALRTLDGGKTWKEILVDCHCYLHQVRFVDEKVGHIASEQSVYKSVDGGETWQKNDTLYGISLDFESEYQGWVADFHGLTRIYPGGRDFVNPVSIRRGIAPRSVRKSQRHHPAFRYFDLTGRLLQ